MPTTGRSHDSRPAIHRGDFLSSGRRVARPRPHTSHDQCDPDQPPHHAEPRRIVIGVERRSRARRRSWSGGQPARPPPRYPRPATASAGEEHDGHHDHERVPGDHRGGGSSSPIASQITRRTVGHRGRPTSPHRPVEERRRGARRRRTAPGSGGPPPTHAWRPPWMAVGDAGDGGAMSNETTSSPAPGAGRLQPPRPRHHHVVPRRRLRARDATWLRTLGSRFVGPTRCGAPRSPLQADAQRALHRRHAHRVRDRDVGVDDRRDHRHRRSR